MQHRVLTGTTVRIRGHRKQEGERVKKVKIDNREMGV